MKLKIFSLVLLAILAINSINVTSAYYLDDEGVPSCDYELHNIYFNDGSPTWLFYHVTIFGVDSNNWSVLLVNVTGSHETSEITKGTVKAINQSSFKSFILCSEVYDSFWYSKGPYNKQIYEDSTLFENNIHGYLFGFDNRGVPSVYLH
jgi:hypothetical protein